MWVVSVFFFSTEAGGKEAIAASSYSRQFVFFCVWVWWGFFSLSCMDSHFKHLTRSLHLLQRTCFDHLSLHFVCKHKHTSLYELYEWICMNPIFFLFPLCPPLYFSLCANMTVPWCFPRVSQMKLKLIAFLIAWSMVYCVWVCPQVYWIVEQYSDMISVTCVRGCWMFLHFQIFFFPPQHAIRCCSNASLWFI